MGIKVNDGGNEKNKPSALEATEDTEKLEEDLGQNAPNQGTFEPPKEEYNQEPVGPETTVMETADFGEVTSPQQTTAKNPETPVTTTPEAPGTPNTDNPQTPSFVEKEDIQAEQIRMEEQGRYGNQAGTMNAGIAERTRRQTEEEEKERQIARTSRAINDAAAEFLADFEEFEQLAQEQSAQTAAVIYQSDEAICHLEETLEDITALEETLEEDFDAANDELERLRAENASPEEIAAQEAKVNEIGEALDAQYELHTTMEEYSQKAKEEMAELQEKQEEINKKIAALKGRRNNIDPTTDNQEIREINDELKALRNEQKDIGTRRQEILDNIKQMRSATDNLKVSSDHTNMSYKEITTTSKFANTMALAGLGRQASAPEKAPFLKMDEAEEAAPTSGTGIIASAVLGPMLFSGMESQKVESQSEIGPPQKTSGNIEVESFWKTGLAQTNETDPDGKPVSNIYSEPSTADGTTSAPSDVSDTMRKAAYNTPAEGAESSDDSKADLDREAELRATAELEAAERARQQMLLQNDSMKLEPPDQTGSA